MPHPEWNTMSSEQKMEFLMNALAATHDAAVQVIDNVDYPRTSTRRLHRAE
jgi:hypothetical protein